MSYLKKNGEKIGQLLLIVAFSLLVAAFILTCIRLLIIDAAIVVKITTTALTTLAIAIGAGSVGLGFISIGMSAKSDQRQTELLEKLDKNIARLPLMLKDDILTPSGQLIAKEIAIEEAGEQSKLAAQKRLDEDTKRVGYVRGEIYQVKNGSWAIAWGGKYPL